MIVDKLLAQTDRQAKIIENELVKLGAAELSTLLVGYLLTVEVSSRLTGKVPQEILEYHAAVRKVLQL